MIHEPDSVEEACDVLATLARDRRTSVIVGGGTQRNVVALDALIRTSRLSRIVDYAPSDQVITVEAGVTLATLQTKLAEEGQRLSLDPPSPARSTVGGIVAANAFGPLRARCGSIRDLILGVSLVRADGVLVKGGGKVVKNVAGFDLPKLACGSMGTLALIARVTLRVHPRPETTETRIVRGLRAEEVPVVIATTRAAQLEPVALLAIRNDASMWDLAFQFEGFAAGVRQQVARLETLAAAEEGGADAFEAHRTARERATLRIKVAALPTALPAVEALMAPLGRRAELAWYPSLGIGFFSSPGEAPDALAIATARRAILALGGSFTVEAMPDDLRAAIPAWDAPSSLRLHEAMKARFDPERLLAPGTFVGGI